jgi:hypothetical protein
MQESTARCPILPERDGDAVALLAGRRSRRRPGGSFNSFFWLPSGLEPRREFRAGIVLVIPNHKDGFGMVPVCTEHDANVDAEIFPLRPGVIVSRSYTRKYSHVGHLPKAIRKPQLPLEGEKSAELRIPTSV